MNNNAKTDGYFFLLLEKVASLLPTYIYWKDKNSIFLGGNAAALQFLGYQSNEELCGKTDYDLWPKFAKKYIADDKIVLSTGKTISKEDLYPDKDGSIKWCVVTKTPLCDENGEIIGIIGNSIDITDQKRAEELQAEKDKLNAENETQRKLIQEQSKFRTIAEQVAHDIRSPLAGLLMMVEMYKNIPEAQRVSLRNVAISIGDIANNLLSQYKNGDIETCFENQISQPILVSLILLETLSEKKYQYKNLPVKFNCSFGPESSFAFINAKPSDFSRMISNLVNNSVEAILSKEEGTVDLKLDIVDEHIRVIVQDDGEGMSQDIVDKIMNNITVTSGKAYGSGIGFTQVRGVLQENKGKMSIESKVGFGTKIMLVFPGVKTSGWIAENISLNKGDTVVVLDDDYSIHEAWEACFKVYKSDVQMKHFKLGDEVIDFINNLTVVEKAKVFLLADFELINQEFNGLQVIEHTCMQQRSIIVTSYYNDQHTRECAAKAGVKILPKQLASNVSITILGKTTAGEQVVTATKKVDWVIVDDEQIFADSLTDFFQSKSLIVDTYYNPERFLENLGQYNKSTKICMDQEFHSYMNGFDLAEKLYTAGYTQLYMLTGREFKKQETPNYLTTLVKGDMETLNKLV